MTACSSHIYAADYFHVNKNWNCLLVLVTDIIFCMCVYSPLIQPLNGNPIVTTKIMLQHISAFRLAFDGDAFSFVHIYLCLWLFTWFSQNHDFTLMRYRRSDRSAELLDLWPLAKRLFFLAISAKSFRNWLAPFIHTVKSMPNLKIILAWKKLFKSEDFSGSIPKFEKWAPKRGLQNPKRVNTDMPYLVRMYDCPLLCRKT